MCTLFFPQTCHVTSSHLTGSKCTHIYCKGFRYTLCQQTFHRFLSTGQTFPSPELGLSCCRTRRKAGWGGQQVLFLKHIWESSIKRVGAGGGRGGSPQNLRKKYSFFKRGSPLLSLWTEAFPKRPPAASCFMADSFRTCKGPNSKPGAFWSQNPAFLSAPGGSLFSQPVPTQPPACKIQPRLRPASLVRHLRPGKIKCQGVGQAGEERTRSNPTSAKCPF